MDTNILNVDMAALGDAAPFATGDPTFCSGCHACLSAVSILRPCTRTGGAIGASSADQSQPTTATATATAGAVESGKGKGKPPVSDAKYVGAGEVEEAEAEVEDGVYDWICEFCGTVNSRLELDDMEKPVEEQESVDYVLEPAPVSTAAASATFAGGKGDEVRAVGVGWGRVGEKRVIHVGIIVFLPFLSVQRCAKVKI